MTIPADVQQLPSEQRSLVIAIGVVLNRARRLSHADSADLCCLLKHFCEAETVDDRAAADEAIWELLVGEPVTVHEMDLDSDDPPDDLAKWKDFVSARVRESRDEAKLTQEQLAERTGLPQSHISRIENAKLSPSFTTLQKIADALKLPLSKFDPNSED